MRGREAVEWYRKAGERGPFVPRRRREIQTDMAIGLIAQKAKKSAKQEDREARLARKLERTLLWLRGDDAQMLFSMLRVVDRSCAKIRLIMASLGLLLTEGQAAWTRAIRPAARARELLVAKYAVRFRARYKVAMRLILYIIDALSTSPGPAYDRLMGVWRRAHGPGSAIHRACLTMIRRYNGYRSRRISNRVEILFVGHGYWRTYYEMDRWDALCRVAGRICIFEFILPPATRPTRRQIAHALRYRSRRISNRVTIRFVRHVSSGMDVWDMYYSMAGRLYICKLKLPPAAKPTRRQIAWAIRRHRAAMPSRLAPDTLGWRAWRWDEKRRLLVSPHQQTAWPTAALQARAWNDEEALRGVDGIHARRMPRNWRLAEWRPPVNNQDGPEDDGHALLIAGIVERYGRYVLGSNGWRAEHAVIRGLVAPSAAIAADLLARYPEAEIVIRPPALAEQPCEKEVDHADRRDHRHWRPAVAAAAADRGNASGSSRGRYGGLDGGRRNDVRPRCRHGSDSPASDPALNAEPG